MIPIKAKFIWNNRFTKAYVKNLNEQNESYAYLPEHDGYIIRAYPKETIVSIEEITAIAAQTNKNPSTVKDILTKPSTKARYIAVFFESKNLHVFYEEHLGEVVEICWEKYASLADLAQPLNLPTPYLNQPPT